MISKRFVRGAIALVPLILASLSVCAAQPQLTINGVPMYGRNGRPVLDTDWEPAPLEVVSRPLSEAARVLRGRFAVAVTYEDPLLLSSDDMENCRGGTCFPRMGKFSLPEDLDPRRSQTLRVGGIADLLDAFHRLNPDGPHFRCLESRYGLHIVPESVRNSSGRRARADSILEKTVSVPQGTRTAYEHLALLCSAVSAASGVPVQVNARSFPQDYAANGLVPPLLIEPTQEQLRPYGFSWGASAVTGREALISLLEGSATTVYWDLRCEPGVDRRGVLSGCALNAGPLVVYVKGSSGEDKVNKTLRYDRCTVCPPLGPPLPPPPSVRDFVPKLDPPRQGK